MMEPVPEEGKFYYAVVTLDDGGDTIEFEAACYEGYLAFGDGNYIDFAYESNRGWFMWDCGISYTVSVYCK